MYLGLGFGLSYRPAALTAITSAPFTPADIPALTLWLDGDDTATITQAGGAVSQWSDKSGKSFHATQEYAANQPVTGARTINARNVLVFDGVNDVLILPSGLYGISAGNSTVFTVLAFDATGAEQRPFIGANGVKQTRYGLTFNTSGPGSFSVVNSPAFATATLIKTFDTNPHAVGLCRNGASITAFYDGAPTASAGAVDFTSSSLCVGARSDDGLSSVDGAIGEVIVYSAALSLTDINRVGAYLATKWGITWAAL